MENLAHRLCTLSIIDGDRLCTFTHYCGDGVEGKASAVKRARREAAERGIPMGKVERVVAWRSGWEIEAWKAGEAVTARTTAERDAYRAALTRHGGSITEAARELGVTRVNASLGVDRLGLRPWLDDTYPGRNPATVGRKGDRRRPKQAAGRNDSDEKKTG